MYKSSYLNLFLLIFCVNVNAQNDSHHHEHKHGGLHHWEIPSKDPDRIILTFNGDPSTKRAVTWRTDISMERGEAQIAIAGLNSSFTNDATSYLSLIHISEPTRPY